MVHHIVLWRFFDHANGNDKKENLRIAMELLNSLEGKISGLNKLICGCNESDDPSAWDLSLYCEFNNWEDLNNYQNHPLHLNVKEFMAKVRKDRAMSDWEETVNLK